MASGSQSLFSCLCVTEGRAVFMPWLLWNFDKQSWSRKELVIIDSSESSSVVSGGQVRVITSQRGTSVPEKRNLALAAARGDWIAWFDDDDWQHPDRLRTLAAALTDGVDIASTQSAWLLDLTTAGWDLHTEFEDRIVFNAAGLTREVAGSRAFPAEPVIGSETVWLDDLCSAYAPRVRRLEDPTLTGLLCHRTNLCNASGKRRLDKHPAELRALIGRRKWADTDEMLDELRARLDAQRDRELEERAQSLPPPGPLRQRPYRLFG